MQQQQLFRTSVPTVDPAEPRTRHCWAWVCSALVNKDKGECAVSVVDTVFVEKQQIWSWFYSNSGGIIRKKPRTKLAIEAVQKEFVKIARAYTNTNGNGNSNSNSNGSHHHVVAVCWFGDQIRTMQFFNAHELLTYLNSLASSDGSACISAFVTPRGDLDPSKYANLEHEFTLHKSGRPQCKLFRLTLGSQRIISMDNKMNVQVNDLVQHYVSYIEKSKKVRVVHCVSLFVLDDFGRLFLWRTDAFETIPVASVGTGTAVAPSTTALLGQSPHVGSLGANMHPGESQRAYDGPHAVNERILARAKAEAMRKPDEKLIDAILSSPTPQQRRPMLMATSSSTPNLSDPLANTSSFDPFREKQRSQLRNSRDWEDALQYLPATSSLSRGRRRTISAAHLVSSQKKGCSGDYCHLQISTLAAKRLENKKSVLGNQRQQSSSSASSSTAAVPAADNDARRRSSVFTATAAANAFVESRASEDNFKFQPRVGNRAAANADADFYEIQKPSSPQRQQHEETVLSQFTIPFKLIAQTRAEKQLVDLFVRRYHNGEDGNYLAEEYYGDGEPLGQTFPGYYYQEVQVCKNCFEFYTLVEKVRMKAQDQIAKKRAAAAKRAKFQGNRASLLDDTTRDTMDVGGNRLKELLVNLDEREEDADAEQDGYNKQARRIWSQIWRHAAAVILPSITKKDAAELYSFTNPHPAIAMVLSCLGIVLLGREGDWTELKRVVSQEKLLGLLQKFDLDHLSLEVVMKAASHARNPLFSPIHIAPISSCAARFCDWILTVLQAYAWRNRAAFKDKDTNRVLCYLKLELLPAGLSEDHLTTRGDGGAESRTGSSGVTSQHSRDTDGRDIGVKSATVSKTGRQTQQKDAARRAIQEQQMARLAAPSGLADALVAGASESVFTCQDGVTKIPYSIAGQAVGETTKCNLVVFHDLFDTLDSTKVFFRSVLARNVGARALFFNFPGQAGSSYLGDSTAEKVVFNNIWQARRAHELFNYLQHTKAFVLSGIPFHFVGFGNGANIAACYTILYGKAYGGYLQSLVLCNGFAKVDAQMAAILHSAVNVFSCFPPSRPDLPVTFFYKFLFSDAYLAKIDPNLVLSIYTAVTNAITLDGRIRICQGALHHMDLVSQLQEIDVPLVIVQSVENALVAPTNVDPFLQGRVNILHAWSHQQPQNGDIRGKTSKQLRQVLATPKSAFVSWLRAGHELRQECKTYITDLMELLVGSKENIDQTELRDTEPTRAVALSPPSSQPARPLQPSYLYPERQTPSDAARKTSASSLAALAEETPTASTPDPSKSKVASRSMQVSLDAPLVEEVTIANSSIEKRQTLKKSAYELQLERSEQEFQEAIKTHEAQKAELEKKKWLTRQTATDDPLQTGVQRPEVAAFKSAVPSNYEVGTQKSQVEFISSAKMAPPSIPTAPAPSTFPKQSTYQTRDDVHDEATKSAVLDTEMDALRQKMVENEQRIERETNELRAKQRAAAEERMEALQQEQERRRREWEEEDKMRLAALERKLQEEQADRVAAMKKREADLLSLDLTSSLAAIDNLPKSLSSSVSPPASSFLVSPSSEETKKQIRLKPDLPSVFDQLEAEEKAKKRIGKLRIDEFDEIKTSMTQTFNEGVRERENTLKAELFKRKNAQATCIQKYVRRYFAIQKVAKHRKQVQQERITRFAGGEIVRIVRGFLGRRKFTKYRVQRKEEEQQAFAAVVIQRLFRGHACRVEFVRKLRSKKVLLLQRVYRGHMGRTRCLELREAQAYRRYMDRNASKIQATWKMYVARDKFLTSRFSVLAAIEIQRMYRGHLGRIEASRKKEWRNAEPGPERLALGLKMIEGSKQAFERQQSEIDALHRAQEAVERQVSSIHSELQESEKELAVLERELQEIDQLEMDLRELTHEAEILHNGGIEGLLRSSHNGSSNNKKPTPLGNGIPQSNSASGAAVPYEAGVESLFETKETMKKRQADAYAIEMAIQIKRAEREKRKKDLEAEFTSVFSEVQQKRQSLAEMEEKLADMEATRMRKDREFARLQRNLMELLEEQKLELESLREKGIELETATATSAAAAAATAMKAKEHEKRSQAMFESTEELMKFQFMSMSLSYFSSLNMLKNLRDINADTTSAAITSTAETAAAAAAAAAAANIPAMNRLKVGGADLMLAASQLKKQELEQKLTDEEDAKKAQLQPLPPEVRNWNVDDVGRWLDSLSLSQYKKAFDEGAVDGEFLLELRPEDMSDVLGVTHKLHVRKIIVARNKLLPLTEQEKGQLDAVHHEENASNTRAQVGVPDLDMVFSQARNGRLKRLVESIDAGFSVDEEDDKGNTLLLIACQNVNMKMVEYLVSKRANVNHKNAQGNTPLHFAMAYDSDGALGEYLIARGADDTIENTFGLTPYDGLTPE